MSSLEEIYDEIRADPYWDHLRTDSIRFVGGVGACPAEVMVVGEAPGAVENTRLRPFCGPAGTVLHQLMKLADLGEDRAYITNTVNYWPKRTPTPEEAVHARDALRKQWTAVGGPRVLVAVGGVALAALWPYGGRGAGTRPPFGSHVALKGGTVLWAMYHPSFALHQPSMRPTCERHWEEFGRWLNSQ